MTVRKTRSGHRLEVYWEEFGTMDEGSMKDRRYHEIARAPTRREMTRVEKGLAELLSKLGLLAHQASGRRGR